MLGREPVAIGPPGLRSQLERVASAVFRDRPAFGGSGNELPGRRIADQALTDVPQDVGGLQATRLLGIEGLGICRQTPVERRVFGARLLGSAAARERPERNEQQHCEQGCSAWLHSPGRYAETRNWRFLRWIRSNETADGVMPSSLDACPSVLGRTASRRWRASLDRPLTDA